MTDAVSGFFSDVNIPGTSKPDNFIRLGGSESSSCQVFRGSRDGKIRVYKALSPQFRGNPLYETALRKEFEIAYSLSHSHVCQTISFLNLPELGNCIEMEWIDGVPLDEYCMRGLSRREKSRLVAQICDALAYIHSHQIVHRDVKPSNIFVTHNGHNIKLMDFSLSDSDSFILLKNPAGTRHYAAPELIASGNAVSDWRCDIWSLGIILAELGLSRWVVSKCCAVEPERRYQSALDVSTSLGRVATLRWLLPLLALVMLFFSVFAGSVISKKIASESLFREATELIESMGF